MTVYENLVAARALIADRRNWCQEAYFKSVKPSPWRRKTIKQYCLLGAIQASASNSSSHFRTHHFLYSISGQSLKKAGGLLPWNDTLGRTHSEVLAFLDFAIQQAKPKSLIVPPEVEPKVIDQRKELMPA